jgi:hypothetical protein
LRFLRQNQSSICLLNHSLYKNDELEQDNLENIKDLIETLYGLNNQENEQRRQGGKVRRKKNIKLKTKRKTKKSKKIVKWKNIKPHSNKSRKNMKTKYGSKCFLEPKTLKYPICNKFNGKQECMGLYAADYYLNLNLGKLNKKLNKKVKSKEKNVYTKKIKKYNKLKSKSNSLKKRLCKKNN